MKELEEKYNLFATISLVIGCVIGAGIFFKVDDVLKATQGNILAGLIGWITVGISVISGAIALSYYAQLIPKEGGLLKYTEFRFGSKASFFVGWFYMTIYYPIIAAVLFTVGSDFLLELIKEFTPIEPTPFHHLVVGIVSMLILFVVNLNKPKVGGIIQSISTVLKTIPLILIAAIGISLLMTGNIEHQNTLTYAAKNIDTNRSTFQLSIASFIPIAFAFDGWYIATQISGEVKNSKRNLPIALIAGTVIVMLIYIFYYLGIVFDMGGEQISNLGNKYISTYANSIGGKPGAILMQLAIVISIFGAGNGLIIAGIRVPYQLAHSGSAKNFFNVLKVNSKTNTPTNSAYFFLALAIFYFIIYYITNTFDFFKKLQFDLSNLPITIVYVVMTCLFLGLFKLIFQNKIAGNKTIKTITCIIAIVGAIIVLYGGITTSNGILYILISLGILTLGLTVLKTNKTSEIKNTKI